MKFAQLILVVSAFSGISAAACPLIPGGTVNSPSRANVQNQVATLTDSKAPVPQQQKKPSTSSNATREG